MDDVHRLDAAFRDALGLPPGTDLGGLAYGGPEGWDSVGHLQVIVALEETFGIALLDEDVVAMSSHAEVRRILRDRYGLAVDGTTRDRDSSAVDPDG